MSKMLLAVAVVACASCGVVGSSGSDDAGYAVASGGQTATGTGGGTGSGGSGGTGGAGSVCTSMRTWTGVDGANMAPGYACVSCHFFSLAGTIYPTAHEANNCDGASAGGISVVITGADGQALTLTPNSAGNFYSTLQVSLPFTAKVVGAGGTREMLTAQTSGDCNSCHTVAGANGAPGRIMIP